MWKWWHPPTAFNLAICWPINRAKTLDHLFDLLSPSDVGVCQPSTVLNLLQSRFLTSSPHVGSLGCGLIIVHNTVIVFYIAARHDSTWCVTSITTSYGTSSWWWCLLHFHHYRSPHAMTTKWEQMNRWRRTKRPDTCQSCICGRMLCRMYSWLDDALHHVLFLFCPTTMGRLEYSSSLAPFSHWHRPPPVQILGCIVINYSTDCNEYRIRLTYVDTTNCSCALRFYID